MKSKKSRSEKTVTKAVRASPPPNAKTPELPFNIPSILLEGDEPPLPAATLNAADLDAGASASAAQSMSGSSGMPATDSTGKMTLLARDPNTLYAHWDLPQEQQEHHDPLSALQYLVVRVHCESGDGPAVIEVRPEPESRHSFIHVDHPGSRYTAELGYYDADGQLATIAVSASVTTPSVGVSKDKSLQFGVVSFEPALSTGAGSFKTGTGFQSESTIKCPVTPSAEIIGAIIPPRLSWIPALGIGISGQAAPLVGAAPNPFEAAAQSEIPAGGGASVMALDRATSGEALSVIPTLEIADWLRLEAEADGLESLSSPTAGAEPAMKGFWFKVGAELVIFGAADPDATVSLAGLPIRLDKDGAFSCRFALPDGQFELVVSARSADGESRHVALKFHRSTTLSEGQQI